MSQSVSKYNLAPLVTELMHYEPEDEPQTLNTSSSSWSSGIAYRMMPADEADRLDPYANMSSPRFGQESHITYHTPKSEPPKAQTAKQNTFDISKFSIEELFETLHTVLPTLSEREQLILKRRYGLAERRDWTLEAIGSHLGISRQRVLQIEQSALKKLHKAFTDTLQNK